MLFVHHRPAILYESAPAVHWQRVVACVGGAIVPGILGIFWKALGIKGNAGVSEFFAQAALPFDLYTPRYRIFVLCHPSFNATRLISYPFISLPPSCPLPLYSSTVHHGHSHTKQSPAHSSKSSQPISHSCHIVPADILVRSIACNRS